MTSNSLPMNVFKSDPLCSEQFACQIYAARNLVLQTSETSYMLIGLLIHQRRVRNARIVVKTWVQLTRLLFKYRIRLCRSRGIRETTTWQRSLEDDVESHWRKDPITNFSPKYILHIVPINTTVLVRHYEMDFVDVLDRQPLSSHIDTAPDAG
jgi:hypothetical protein